MQGVREGESQAISACLKWQVSTTRGGKGWHVRIYRSRYQVANLVHTSTGRAPVHCVTTDIRLHHRTVRISPICISRLLPEEIFLFFNLEPHYYLDFHIYESQRRQMLFIKLILINWMCAPTTRATRMTYVRRSYISLLIKKPYVN